MAEEVKISKNMARFVEDHKDMIDNEDLLTIFNRIVESKKVANVYSLSSSEALGLIFVIADLSNEKLRYWARIDYPKENVTLVDFYLKGNKIYEYLLLAIDPRDVDCLIILHDMMRSIRSMKPEHHFTIPESLLKRVLVKGS